MISFEISLAWALFTGKNIDALKQVLRNAPITSRNQMVKVSSIWFLKLLLGLVKLHGLKI